MSIVQSGLPVALSVPFILATWIAFMHRRRVAARPGTGQYAAVGAGGLNPGDACFAAATVDLEAALRKAAEAANSSARLGWVRIDLALGAAMMVPVDPTAFGMVLCETMLTAIRAAPGGQVLVTTATLGSQLHIRVTDDGAGADQWLRETAMRQTEALIALQGGSIAVDARPGRGTTVTIRLPMPAPAEGEPNALAQLPVLADHDA
jgi:two-component system, cell cycle sensor histidine kinase PleC